MNYLDERVDEEYIRTHEATIKKFLTKNFCPINVYGIEKVKETAREQPVIFVANHSSHLDYFLIGYQIYNGLKELTRIVAGDNLFSQRATIFLKLLKLNLEKLGGIKLLRKEYLRNQIYTEGFNKECVKIYKKGKNLLFFGSAGRSEDGLLNIGGRIRADSRGLFQIPELAAYDMRTVVIPVAISYDMPPEAEVLHLLSKNKRARNKKKGPMKWLVQSAYYSLDFSQIFIRYNFFRPYGEVHINFAEPIEVQKGIKAKEIMTEARGGIVKEFTITPSQIIGKALSTKVYITRNELGREVEKIILDIQRKNLNVSGAISHGGIDRVIDDGLKYYLKIGAVKEQEDRSENKGYHIKKRDILTLNANYMREPFEERIIQTI
jgi:1-acyl-sn-glycerol-3-phosphate acyltransferase